jgi:hypothetical protein
MKLKGLSKIAIAGAALAATAATLGTSTYAWYVSNQEATATGVVAQMQDSTGGSVYISKDGENFKSSVVFNAQDFADPNDANNVNAEFIPLTTDDALAFTKMGTDGTLTSATGNKLVVSVWLKADSAINVTPRLGVANTSTAASVEQTLYADINNTYSAGDTLAVDVVEALRMAVDVDDAGAPTIYDVKSIAKNPANLAQAYGGTSGFASATDVAVTGRSDNLGAAHGYFKDVTGAAPADTEPASAATSWGNISLAANSAKKLTFTFWLEGADTECFDSCAGQTVQFTFDFLLAA